MEEMVSLTLNPVCLALLTYLLQKPPLPGLHDPFMGLLADEIEEQWEKAAEELSAKGFIEIRPDGTVVMDEGIYAIVESAASSQRTLVVSRDVSSEKVTQRFVHLTEDFYIEQRTLSDDQVVLTVFSDQEKFTYHVRSFLNLPDVPAADGPTITTDEDTFRETQSLVGLKGKQAGITFLKQREVPPEIANALAETLAGNPSFGTIAMLHRSEQEIRYGETFGWLLGPNGGWHIIPLVHQEPMLLRLVPASTERIWQQIVNLIKMPIGS